jgi:hypothetical protein
LLEKLGEVDWTERNAAIREFWTRKEAEIDALVSEAKKSLEKTVTRKRLVVVEPEPAGVLGDKLKAALKDRLQTTRTPGKLSLDKTR